MTTRFLKHRKTGVVFVHTEMLAKHPELVPHEMARSVEPELPPDPAGDEPPKLLAKMTKAEMIEAAEANFGIDLDPNLKADELRAELARLMEAGE